MAKLKTGRHTSALKATRQAEKRAAANKAVKSKIKGLVKKVEGAVSSKDNAQAKDLLNVAFGEWDKAVKRNVVHKNAASNQKARLSKLVNSIAG